MNRRVLAFVLACGAALPHAARAESPWRLQEALGVPWLHLSLEHRARAEHLAHDYRAATLGIDVTALSLRTLALAEAGSRWVSLGVELLDARAVATDPAALNPTIVNPLDVLQAYARLRVDDAGRAGDRLELTLGRQTLDLGSRRLLARNEFRNTINAFTGVHAHWRGVDQAALRAFAVVPVLRLPTTPAELDQAALAADRESMTTALWGVWASTRPFHDDLRVEGYVLGVHERDVPGQDTANRQLVTPGVRVVRAPAPWRPDLDIEAMGQLGATRASPLPDDVTDLAHAAFALHAAAGMRLGVPLTPRPSVMVDVASGDRDPKDTSDQRFDPLFGARRFELAPTGLYGAVPRSNIVSPALRLDLELDDSVDAFLSYRALWLASPTDAWTPAALRDPAGRSGRFVGQQPEVRVRWFPVRGNLVLDVGAAVLFPGEVPARLEDQPTPTSFVYAQAVVNL